jgi:hypothetical protein
MPIGIVADWPLLLAREEARRLRRLVDQGEDPLAARNEHREAPTVTMLIERWREEAAPKKRRGSIVEDDGLIREWIDPEFGDKKVIDVKRAHIEALHWKITKAGTPIRANRTVAF